MAMITIWSDAIMTATFMAPRPAAEPEPARKAGGGLRGFLRRWRARRALADLDVLDDRLLADIGLRREQLTPELVLRAEDHADARPADGPRSPAGLPALSR
jgi:uncharacterized protein YjiS (DUF1127 family)